MSANNIIMVREIGPDEFCVTNEDAEFGYSEAIANGIVGLREAVIIARYEDSEYGIGFEFIGD